MKKKSVNPISRPNAIFMAGLLSILLLLGACGGMAPKPNAIPAPKGRDFTMEFPARPPIFATKEELTKEKSEETPYMYQLGPGDVIKIKVWRRPELSQDQLIVSPDGFISAPRIGLLYVSGKTPAEVQQMITTKLEILYIKPEIIVQVQEFLNNKAFVLGGVSNPGIVKFTGRGTLLEGLALAGGVPKESRMTRCSIIRGNDRVIWINLQDLLSNGNMSLNTTIRNNDVIYVPERSDDMVFVMGEVKAPGAIRLHDGMNVLKAVMLAGGLMRTASPENVFIIRQHDLKGSVVKINLKELIETADFSRNFTLIPNDIVYVSPSGMAKFNYALDNITPSLQVLSLGISNAESLGIMQEVRQELWGQEGFVSPSN